MKTKLLKIVRKQYSITRYDKKPQNTNHVLYKGGYVFPVWCVENTENECNFSAYSSKEDALKGLIYLIRFDWLSAMKRPDKKEKVWYK